jgi:hypothetical protein
VGRKAKKVYILTDEDRAEIEKILLNLVREMQQFLDKHHDPKKFAEKLLSAFGSNIAIAGQIQKRYSLGMESGQQVSPQYLWKILPQEMQDTKSHKYLKPHQRTGILHQLQMGGYYEPVQPSKKVKHPGRPKSEGIVSSDKERGGRPSKYTITLDIIKLKRFIANEKANQYIHNRLNSIGIFQEFFKFLMLSFFHALKKEHNRKEKKETMVDSLVLLLPFFNLSKRANLTNWNVDQFLSMDEKQLDMLAQEISYTATEHPLSYLIFVETAF